VVVVQYVSAVRTCVRCNHALRVYANCADWGVKLPQCYISTLRINLERESLSL
jgi:hypothetical protein